MKGRPRFLIDVFGLIEQLSNYMGVTENFSHVLPIPYIERQLCAMVNKSFMKVVNRIGPKIDPCETKDTSCFDMLSLILTDWDLVPK